MTSEKAGHSIDAITTAHQQPGVDEVTDDDPALADPVTARIVQPGLYARPNGYPRRNRY